MNPHTSRRTLVESVATLTALAAVLTLLVWQTGGGSVRVFGIKLAAGQPTRSLILVVVGLMAFKALTRVSWRQFAPAFSSAARPDWLILVLAFDILLVGMTWGSRTGGGADSYGYISQADLLLKGDLVTDMPLAQEAPWPNAIDTFAPLGYRPAVHFTRDK